MDFGAGVPFIDVGLHWQDPSLNADHVIQLAVVSVLIKEKKQLRDALRRCEETEHRVERIKNEPIARKRLASLKREMDRDGMQPHHLQELRELLDDFPEQEAYVVRILTSLLRRCSLRGRMAPS
ncbi:hypothetical protein GY45DRAFT_1320775 [Cubamyces sp. BRFM 1775]|nr:hypothetical protein GY45DRAFT_1320775 [Cubamyces sp. BRFM 1775]